MTDKWAGVLWQRFKDMYGQKWISLFQGDEAIEMWRVTWASGLQVDADQIKYALSLIGAEFPDWPPTFGQFKALCESMPKKHLALPPPPKGKPSHEVMEKFRNAVAKIGTRSGPWWIPERVRNWGQVNFIVIQANRFGHLSPAARFLQECKDFGCITEDNQMRVKP